MLRIFKGTCEAVRAMHDFRATPSVPQPSQSNGGPSRQEQANSERHSDDDERFPQPEGDGDGGYSYDSSSVPLVTRHHMEDEGDVVFDGDEELAENANGGNAGKEVVPYAHRDLKPGYVFSRSDFWLNFNH